MTAVLADELKLLRDTVRTFVTRELQPIERVVDERDEIPPEDYARLRKKAAEMGLLGLAYPVAYGGSGLGVLAQCVVREEFGKSSDALRIACTQGSNKMLLAGTEEQKARYLAPAIRGERLMAFAITEPDAGSDAAGDTESQTWCSRPDTAAAAAAAENLSEADIFLGPRAHPLATSIIDCECELLRGEIHPCPTPWQHVPQ